MGYHKDRDIKRLEKIARERGGSVPASRRPKRLNVEKEYRSKPYPKPGRTRVIRP